MTETENQGVLASFLSKLLAFFDKQKVDVQTENDALVDYALKNDDRSDSDPNKLIAQDYRVILEAVDNTNKSIKDYYDLKQPVDVDAWGADQVRPLVKKMKPDATDPETDNIIDDVLVKVIKDTSIEIATDIAGRELTEDELNDAKKED